MSRDTSPGILRYVVIWAALASITAGTGCISCNDGIAAAGEPCETVADCESGHQCLDHICKPACKASEECGDGFTCDGRSCRVVVSEPGDPCTAELGCGPGQTCRLGEDDDAPVTCALETLGAPIGAACREDADCRAGACALGRCVALCDGECPSLHACVTIPRVSPDATAQLGEFTGCLPTGGNLVFDIPIDPTDTSADLFLPVPSNATSLMLVAEVLASTHLIGATKVIDTNDEEIYHQPIDPEEYYTQDLRHQPLGGIAVLQIPSTSAAPLQREGFYKVTVATFADGLPTATPRRLRVIEKLDYGASLKLSFHFLDLSDHPCELARGLNALTAASDPGFRAYFAEIDRIFGTTLTFPAPTFSDLLDHPELDAPAASDIGDLFELSTEPKGIPIYFVRSLSPAGTEIAVGGTPGAPLPGTRASGIAIAATSLCYQTWPQLARQTAHAIARHMGLYRNVEPDPRFGDPIADTPDTMDNLMYWGENGGTTLSPEQRDILRVSPVLD